MTISFTQKLISYYLPVAAWCVFIFLLSAQSSLPGPSDAALNFIFKKAAHMFVYAVLYWLLFRAVNAGKSQKSLLIPFLIAIAYAVSDEIHQRFTAGRTSTIRDVGYDALGAMVALLRIKSLI